MVEPSRRPGRPAKEHPANAPDWSRRLRLAREKAGLSIIQLAARAGLKQAAVARYDAGERTPNVVDGLAIAAALGLDPAELFG